MLTNWQNVQTLIRLLVLHEFRIILSVQWSGVERGQCSSSASGTVLSASFFIWSLSTIKWNIGTPWNNCRIQGPVIHSWHFWWHAAICGKIKLAINHYRWPRVISWLFGQNISTGVSQNRFDMFGQIVLDFMRVSLTFVWIFFDGCLALLWFCIHEFVSVFYG